MPRFRTSLARGPFEERARDGLKVDDATASRGPLERAHSAPAFRLPLSRPAGKPSPCPRKYRPRARTEPCRPTTVRRLRTSEAGGRYLGPKASRRAATRGRCDRQRASSCARVPQCLRARTRARRPAHERSEPIEPPPPSSSRARELDGSLPRPLMPAAEPYGPATPRPPRALEGRAAGVHSRRLGTTPPAIDRAAAALSLSPRMTAIFGGLFGLATVTTVIALLIQSTAPRDDRAMVASASSASTEPSTSADAAEPDAERGPKKRQRNRIPGPVAHRRRRERRRNAGRRGQVRPTQLHRRARRGRHPERPDLPRAQGLRRSAKARSPRQERPLRRAARSREQTRRGLRARGLDARDLAGPRARGSAHGRQARPRGRHRRGRGRLLRQQRSRSFDRMGRLRARAARRDRRLARRAACRARASRRAASCV
jgi:hypothetical protein